MLALRDLQGRFWHALADDPGRCAADPALLAHAEPSATLQPAERLQVYVDAYSLRLLEALHETYPRVAAAVGPDRFASSVREYLKAYPSEHPSISYAGRQFASFIATRQEWPAHLVDLAQLEWARAEVFEAADAVPLTLDALCTVSPEDFPRLRFTTIPALTVIRCTWPAHATWRDPSAGGGEAQPTALRVWRAPGWRVLHAPMDAREDDALRCLRAGKPFEDICMSFADLPEEQAPEHATALLLRWLEDGILAKAQVLQAQRPAATGALLGCF